MSKSHLPIYEKIIVIFDIRKSNNFPTILINNNNNNKQKIINHLCQHCDRIFVYMPRF